MNQVARPIPVPSGHLQVHQFGSAGPRLLLAHGFPLDHTMWHGQWEGLAARCRLIVPDLRGFGDSSITVGTVTMEAMAGDLLQVMDFLAPDEPFFFGGLSMGGYVGWQLWRLAPERLLGLIQCDTRAASDSVEVARGRQLMAGQVLSGGMGGVAAGMLPKLFAECTFQRQPALVEATRTVIDHAPTQGVAAAQRGMALRPDMTSQISQIALPSLLICGDEDQISPPEEMRRMADAMPRAQLAIIPAAGHMSPLEQPQQVNMAIADFLEQSCPP